MPKENQERERITFSIEPKLKTSIKHYQHEKEYDSTSATIRELLEKGLAVVNGPTAPDTHSANAIQLAAVFDSLDIFGQIALKETADREKKRMKAQQKAQKEAEAQMRAIEMVHRPLAAHKGTQPLDLSTLQPISAGEVEQSDLDL